MYGKAFPAAIVTAMLLISLILYPFLPEQLPVHWNLQGNVDGMGHKAVVVWIFPLLTVALWGLFHLSLNLTAFKERYGEAQATHVFIINMVLLFLGFMHALMLLAGLYPELSVVRAIAIGGGGLIAALGNVLGRLRPNPMFGIRLPWTLNDEEVWRRVHRTGGRWMFASGLVIMLAALVLPPEMTMILLIVLLLSGTLWTVLYSRQLWMQRHQTTS